MFSKIDDKKTSIFGAMKCSNCGKEIGKEEQLTLKVKAKDLKGYTYLAVSYTHLTLPTICSV